MLIIAALKFPRFAGVFSKRRTGTFFCCGQRQTTKYERARRGNIVPAAPLAPVAAALPVARPPSLAAPLPPVRVVVPGSRNTTGTPEFPRQARDAQIAPAGNGALRTPERLLRSDWDPRAPPSRECPTLLRLSGDATGAAAAANRF